MTAFINTKKSARPSRMPKPFRYPRPEKPRRTPSTLDEIKRFARGRR